MFSTSLHSTSDASISSQHVPLQSFKFFDSWLLMAGLLQCCDEYNSHDNKWVIYVSNFFIGPEPSNPVLESLI
jgi:hypothetical protein